MNAYTYVPSSLRDAGCHVRAALAVPLCVLPKHQFLRAWASVVYLFPGLHPDGFADQHSGWPRVPQRFAAEAWRRAEAGEINEEELYPSDAVWSGLFDRMLIHLPEETERRVQIASLSRQIFDA
jgi:hypothetical protein